MHITLGYCYYEAYNQTDRPDNTVVLQQIKSARYVVRALYVRNIQWTAALTHDFQSYVVIRRCVVF